MDNPIKRLNADCCLYVSINLLFIIKYSLRTSLALCLAASSLYVITLYLFITHNKAIRNRLSPKATSIIFAACIALLVVAQYSIDPYQLNVDRWSAIHNFLSYLFQGKYPYMAPTHLGGYGSPFPVWQIVHIPFYLLRNVGLSLIAALVLLGFIVKRYVSPSVAVNTLFLFLLSPALLFEALVRSDLMANFIVSAIIVTIFYKRNITLQHHFPLIALACGLLMSTRLTAVLPVALYVFCDWWRQDAAKKALFPLAVLMLFGLTFLPFVCWDANDLFFFRYNPFILQSRQAHPVDILPIALIFLFLATAWTKGKGNAARLMLLMRATALLLLAIVAIVFAHNMIVSGNYRLFSSTYDITYLDMSLPFFILSIALDLATHEKGSMRKEENPSHSSATNRFANRQRR